MPAPDSAARDAPAEAASPGAASGRAERSTTAQNRLQTRYPRRRRSKWVLILTLVLVAVVGLGWLGWAAWQHSHPPVSGQIPVWKVSSARKASFTLTVDRPDASVPVACRVVAQSHNHETVGERTIRVPATAGKVVDVRKTIRTLHRATSVSLDRCWTT